MNYCEGTAEEALERAVALASRIARNGPLALENAKRAVDDVCAFFVSPVAAIIPKVHCRERAFVVQVKRLDFCRFALHLT